MQQYADDIVQRLLLDLQPQPITHLTSFILVDVTGFPKIVSSFALPPRFEHVGLLVLRLRSVNFGDPNRKLSYHQGGRGLCARGRPGKGAGSIVVGLRIQFELLCWQLRETKMYHTHRARVRLGRIRCLTRTIQCMKRGTPLPEPICFVPKEMHLEYEGLEGEGHLDIVEEPREGAKVLATLSGAKKTELVCAGRPFFNAQGGWVRVRAPCDGWALVQPANRMLKGTVTVVRDSTCSNAGDTEDGSQLLPWLTVVEQACTLRIDRSPLAASDEAEVKKLQTPPPGWSLQADEQLSQFIVRQTTTLSLVRDGSAEVEHFVKIEASSEEDEIPNLFDNDPETFWESDGVRGAHWLRFYMKPSTVVKQFSLLVNTDLDDASYFPKRVVVKTGSPGHLTTLHTCTFGLTEYQTGELQLLPRPLESYEEVIEVQIQSCHENGIDTRVWGVSVVTHAAKKPFPPCEVLSEEDFLPDKIMCYPKLQALEPKQLLYRGLVLKRAAYLLDRDLPYVLPHWQPSHAPDESSLSDTVSTIRQLWPLSGKRDAIIRQLLGDTATSAPSRPIFRVNRIAANEHRENPQADPSGRKTVFCQIIQEIKRETNPVTYTFRWAGQMAQWWECKFIQEGLVDLGGGFRDSLADMADELCPTSLDSPVALPLFIRSPNQSQDSSNAYRDAYVPNPGCTHFAWYRFVGQLMGAMFRSQEKLVLSLPQFVWKELVGEGVTWERDFVSVDSAEVKLLSSIETMTKEKFDVAFAGALTYNTVRSDGENVPLLEDSESLVTYEERLEYCKLVKEVKMKEFRAQTGAIRSGLTTVVPGEVLQLLTWQELETRVSGNPEISIEDLKKSTRYNGGLRESSPKVERMWNALEQFSNDERSRFLRFITGRRRLPCTIFIDSSSSNSKLPSSSTCSNTLYLPEYDSVEEAVDRLRYASYNCVAIDTDMAPYNDIQ